MLRPLKLGISGTPGGGIRPGPGLSAFGLAIMARHTPEAADPRLAAQLTLRRESQGDTGGQSLSLNLQLLMNSYADVRNTFLTGRRAILRQLERQLVTARPELRQAAAQEVARALDRLPASVDRLIRPGGASPAGETSLTLERTSRRSIEGKKKQTAGETGREPSPQAGLRPDQPVSAPFAAAWRLDSDLTPRMAQLVLHQTRLELEHTQYIRQIQGAALPLQSPTGIPGRAPAGRAAKPSVSGEARPPASGAAGLPAADRAQRAAGPSGLRPTAGPLPDFPSVRSARTGPVRDGGFRQAPPPALIYAVPALSARTAPQTAQGTGTPSRAPGDRPVRAAALPTAASPPTAARASAPLHLVREIARPAPRPAVPVLARTLGQIATLRRQTAGETALRQSGDVCTGIPASAGPPPVVAAVSGQAARSLRLHRHAMSAPRRFVTRSAEAERANAASALEAPSAPGIVALAGRPVALPGSEPTGQPTYATPIAGRVPDARPAGAQPSRFGGIQPARYSAGPPWAIRAAEASSDGLPASGPAQLLLAFAKAAGASRSDDSGTALRAWPTAGTWGFRSADGVAAATPVQGHFAALARLSRSVRASLSTREMPVEPAAGPAFPAPERAFRTGRTSGFSRAAAPLTPLGRATPRGVTPAVPAPADTGRYLSGPGDIPPTGPQPAMPPVLAAHVLAIHRQAARHGAMAFSRGPSMGRSQAAGAPAASVAARERSYPARTTAPGPVPDAVGLSVEAPIAFPAAQAHYLPPAGETPMVSQQHLPALSLAAWRPPMAAALPGAVMADKDPAARLQQPARLIAEGPDLAEQAGSLGLTHYDLRAAIGVRQAGPAGPAGPGILSGEAALEAQVTGGRAPLPAFGVQTALPLTGHSHEAPQEAVTTQVVERVVEEVLQGGNIRRISDRVYDTLERRIRQERRRFGL